MPADTHAEEKKRRRFAPDEIRSVELGIPAGATQ